MAESELMMYKDDSPLPHQSLTPTDVIGNRIMIGGEDMMDEIIMAHRRNTTHLYKEETKESTNVSDSSVDLTTP